MKTPGQFSAKINNQPFLRLESHAETDTPLRISYFINFIDMHTVMKR